MIMTSIIISTIVIIIIIIIIIIITVIIIMNFSRPWTSLDCGHGCSVLKSH